eukprot:TRINITY_DN1559_c0_g3_i1.p1 TRINITY_DN1559_c0_g3~~TRINITY_DN1559_c0_g3_i1.p1  ORF type:complete len:1082 (+),score=418.62 TRINITY_DN1559_c0_g3_i1:64-3309(+)
MSHGLPAPLDAKHTVFTSKVVESKLAIPVSAMCMFGEGLLILGHEDGDGTISVFRVGEANSGLAPAAQYSRPKSKGLLAVKAAVTQLVPVVDLNLLLALVDGTILQLEIRAKGDASGQQRWSVELQKEVSATHKVTVMAVKKEHDKFYLAAGCKQKHLHIAEYRKEEAGFSVRHDLNLPNTPTHLAWNRHNVYVGFKKEVGRIDISPGTNPGIVDIPGCACGATMAATNEVLLFDPKTGKCDTGHCEPPETAADSDKSGPAPPPRTRFGAFGFRYAPQQVEFSYPFLLALSDQGVEVQTLPLIDDDEAQVRNVSCQLLAGAAHPKLISLANYVDVDAATAQAASIRGPGVDSAAVIQDGKGDRGMSIKTESAPDYATPQPTLYVLTGQQSVVALTPVPFRAQVDEMISKESRQCFESALVLSKQLTRRDVPDSVVEKVNSKHGFLLFARKDYSAAMRAFDRGNVDPRLIIKMYGMLPTYVVNRYRPLPEDVLSIEKAQAAGLAADAVPRDQRNALRWFKSWLRLHRKNAKAQRNTAMDETTSSRRDSIHPVDADTADPLKEDDTEEGMKGASVDTASMLVFLACMDHEGSSEDEVIRELANCPRCVYKDCERALRKCKMWRAIVALKASKGLSRAALTFLQELGKGRIPPPDYETEGEAGAAAPAGVEADLRDEMRGMALTETIHYLQKLDKSDPVHAELILEFSEWVLRAVPPPSAATASPTGGVGDAWEGKVLDMFWHTAEKQPASPRSPNSSRGTRRLTPLQVLQHLRKHMPEDYRRQAQYMSKIVEGDDWESNTPQTHEELIKVYISLILQLRKYGKGADADGVQAQLRAFLQKSSIYQYKRMVDYEPLHQKCFAQESSIIRQKLGEHREALRLLVHELESPADAEKYCNTYYVPQPPGGGGGGSDDHEQRHKLHYLLLELYLQPPPGMPAQVDRALQLLEDHADKIDCRDAIKLLPDSTSIAQTQAWIAKVFREKATQAREMQIKRNIAAAELQQVSVQLVHKQQARVEVDSRTKCRCCNFKIGTSQFARYPNGTIVHSSCVSKYGGSATVCPATKDTFSDLDDFCAAEAMRDDDY